MVLETLPAEPYRAGGNILIREAGYELDAVDGSYRDFGFDLDGHLGAAPSFDASDLRIRVTGEDLSWAASVGGLDDLPAEPFDLLESTTDILIGCRRAGDSNTLVEP